MRLDALEQASGYIVRDRAAVSRILAVEADLLRSEGIDPAWPGFDERPEPEAST